jgi:N-acetylglucosamine-6-phosphate deacetylase
VIGSNCFCLVNGRVITPDSIISPGGVVVEGSRIKQVAPQDQLSIPLGSHVLDVQGRYISPGFIDLHLHGGGGADTMDATPDALRTIARTHARGGATAIVPSTVTSSIEELMAAIAAFDDAMKEPTGGAKLLGLHLEGPYFAMGQRGAQDPRYIKNPSPEEYLPILESSPWIVRISVAPELPGALELGRTLKSRGILASIGHTEATYDDVLAAAEAGYSHVTHIYSAMSMMKRVNGYRVCGVVEAGLLLDGLTVEVIADGKHLPECLLKLVYKCKGPDQIALVTDATCAAGMPPGEYRLGSAEDGQTIIVEDGVAWVADRSVFAGSVALANWLVRTMVSLADVDVVNAVKMASLTPARILGIDNAKGSISRGKDADLVVFDDDFAVWLTMVEGDTVFSKLE